MKASDREVWQGLHDPAFANIKGYEKVKHLRWRLYERDNKTCQLCGKHLAWEDSSIDHILPSSLGGADDWSNYQIAHLRCNKSKGNGVSRYCTPSSWIPIRREKSRPKVTVKLRLSGVTDERIARLVRKFEIPTVAVIERAVREAAEREGVNVEARQEEQE